MRRKPGRIIDEPMRIAPEIESLARRPYCMIVWHDDENGWAAEIPDLPGLSAAGDTLEEMMATIEEEKLLWIAAALAEGRPVPAPREELVAAQ